MKLTVSKPVQLVLMATVVGSIFLLLRAEPVELPLPPLARTSSIRERDTAASKTSDRDDLPWTRPVLPDPVPPEPTAQQASGMPPLPGAGVTAVAGSTPPLPPLPDAMRQPDVVYLGRMIKDGKVQVFFASNGDPVVLSAGEVLNGIWRIQEITPTDVTLHHLQTGETRLIATGGSADTHPTSAAPTQVGHRFLASQPTQRQQPD
ncbi:hypothetical protein SBC1_56130 (plasmid) [Caballeronia sp. SBC1]|uniref:hypothetical protein n=1 Tax=unclassified Caballeronia TaxID=2646786 RepID=UPI0013E1E7C1|nr:MULTISPECIES: hypothetical protein [unclassified Caballeronia]QIE27507.1 hypothetical protein SBC2_55810 [Caballeronia sp. SBC2]QIN65568.1 hypothetical protein SBC1_56130 [Caballeronia sp. SBC1]